MSGLAISAPPEYDSCRIADGVVQNSVIGVWKGGFSNAICKREITGTIGRRLVGNELLQLNEIAIREKSVHVFVIQTYGEPQGCGCSWLKIHVHCTACSARKHNFLTLFKKISVTTLWNINTYFKKFFSVIKSEFYTRHTLLYCILIIISHIASWINRITKLTKLPKNFA